MQGRDHICLALHCLKCRLGGLKLHGRVLSERTSLLTPPPLITKITKWPNLCLMVPLRGRSTWQRCKGKAETREHWNDDVVPPHAPSGLRHATTRPSSFLMAWHGPLLFCTKRGMELRFLPTVHILIELTFFPFPSSFSLANRSGSRQKGQFSSAIGRASQATLRLSCLTAFLTKSTGTNELQQPPCAMLQYTDCVFVQSVRVRPTAQLAATVLVAAVAMEGVPWFRLLMRQKI